MGTIVLALTSVTGIAGLPDSSTLVDEKSDLQKQVTDLIVPLVAAHEIVGVDIITVSGRSGVSHMSIGETKALKPVSPEHPTLFEIGSITKTFTGLILADMVLKREVGIHDPVERYLPTNVKVPTFGERKITLEDLATHTSGLPRLPDNLNPKNPLNPYADLTEEQVYDCLSRVKLSSRPGDKYEYSNLGMGLLGLALSRRAGSSYDELVQSRVLTPLRMKNTYINLSAVEKGRLSIPHDADGDVTSYWDIPVLSGAGAIKSTINDMAIYLVANMFERPTPLQEIIEFAQKPRHDAGMGMKIGLAWHIMKDGQTVWHNGGTGGFRSFIGFESKKQIGVVLLCNSASELVDLIGVDILNILKKEPIIPIPIKSEIVVSPAILKNYAGSYSLSPAMTLTVTLENGKLKAQITGQPKFVLHAKSTVEFFYRVVDARVTFSTNGSGLAKKLTLNQNGRMIVGERKK